MVQISSALKGLSNFVQGRSSSFAYLNITQFLGALNDNIFRLLIVYFLIDWEGIENSDRVGVIAGATFVLPFLLFSAAAGKLADRFSKRNIIVFAKVLELAVMSLGVAAFALETPIGGYVILFLMATQSAIFGPSKYGIIPELVPEQRISQANGLVTSFTYLAIIFGTFFASFITQLTGRNFVFCASICTAIALFGVASSLYISYTKPMGTKKRFHPFFFVEIWKSLRKANQEDYLLTAMIGSAMFFFLGAFIQINIIPFANQSLGLTDIEGGYLFSVTAIGIGTGAIIAGKLSGKGVELGLVPLAGLTIVIACFWLDHYQSVLSVVVPLLIFLGIGGGVYVVPLDAFIQVSAPSAHRGQIVAAANFLSFVGVLMASGVLALFHVLGVRATEAFVFLGYMAFFGSVFVSLIMLDHVLRLLASFYVRFFCKVHVEGTYPVEAPAIFLCRERGWVDAAIVAAAHDQCIRFFVKCQAKRFSFLRPILRLIKMVPLRADLPWTDQRKYFRSAQKAMDRGFFTCIFEDEEIRSQGFEQFSRHIQRNFRGCSYPVIPVTLETIHPGYFFGLIGREVKLSFEKPSPGMQGRACLEGLEPKRV